MDLVTALGLLGAVVGILGGAGGAYAAFMQARSNRNKPSKDASEAWASLLAPLEGRLQKVQAEYERIDREYAVLRAAHTILLDDHNTTLVRFAALVKKVDGMERERTAQDIVVKTLGEKVAELERERVQLTEEVSDLRGGVQTLVAQLRQAGIEPRYWPPKER